MDRSDIQRSRAVQSMAAVLKGLLPYALAPFLLLWFLAPPIGAAVRRSDAAAFLILLAILGVVLLNEYIYYAIHRKRPSLLLFAYGLLCLIAVVIIEEESLPADCALVSTLAIIGGFLMLMFLLVLSFWFARRPSRPAHAAAVGLRITVALILFFMAYQIVRDVESRIVSRDTWITLAILVVTILARNAPRIFSAYRRAMSRRRATGIAAGIIMQIVGETRLDRDDDLVTRNHACVRYVVDDELYETRADISRFTTRRYGRKAFIGREIPVFYNPEDPSVAFTNRINRHVFDG